MDPTRFDDLTRLFNRSGGRRSVLGALLGALLGPAGAGAARKRRKDRGKDKVRDRDQDWDREAGQQLEAERRGKGGKRRKHKKKRHGGSAGGQTPPPPPDCCGTESCASPEPGSTRANCDFSGHSFVGQDHNGSIFRGIDGRGTRFTATDNQGSVFAEACLQGARFRRAKLGGSTWGKACLFDADFTGADLGGDLTLFDDAQFCGTTMPDGSINNRDCDRSSRCCQRDVEPGPGPGPGPTCQNAGDCPDEACHTKTCQGGQCVYAAVADGPDPTEECGANASGHCCEGECCATGATECNQDGLCCVPNCAGRNCGDDGCGGSCGTCPSGVDCDQTSGRCACGAANCPNGCCASDGSCQPGNSDGSCGTGGEVCAQCTAQEECTSGACAPVACTGFCGESGDCPDVPNCICNLEAGGVCCRPNCAGKVCGSDGCSGSCGPCAIGQQCSADGTACICTNTSCGPPINGCCIGNGCEPGNTADACGFGGFACEVCPESWNCISPSGGSAFCECTPVCTDRTCGPNGCGGNCGICDESGQRCTDQGLCICDAVKCPSGCCDFNGLGPCVPGSTSQFCGTGGAVCVSCAAGEVCCGGSCQTEPIVWANVTTFGSEGSGPGQLAGPFGVAVSADGQTAWVSDTANNRVSVWTRTGPTTWTNLTTFGSGPGSDEDEFHDPMGLAVSADEQTVWVTDNGNNRVSVWTRTGPTTWANLTTFGEEDFNDPFDVAVSADEQTVWVADTRNNLISIWTRTGPATWTNLHNFGVGGDGRDEFDFPTGVAVSSLLGEDVILVADSGNNRIAVWEGSGTSWGQVAAFGSVGSGPGQLNAPGGVAVAANTGTVAVADSGNSRVSVWVTPDFATWTLQFTFGSEGAGPSQIEAPEGVALSPDGQTVWVADTGNSRISVWALMCASG